MALTLRQRIQALRIPNAFGEYFVPFRDLERALDEDTVKRALSECSIEAYQREETKNVVLKGGRRVFAALCMIERERLITRFLEHDNFLDTGLDSKLPFEETELRRIAPDDYRSFYDIQWEFSAPIFKPNLHHRELHDRCVLPFVKVDSIGTGGFGVVSRVFLAASNQDICPNSTEKVEIVRKELQSSGAVEEDYKREQHVLSLLRCLQHPNIIQFYTAYTLNQKPTLLFAPADYNLMEFFSQPLPPCFQSDEAIFQALYGLSSAIAHMHNYFSEEIGISMVGCHYDLKPKNILVKHDKFILADFGISRLKTEADGSISGFKAGVSDYFAPECQNLSSENIEKHGIGRSSDIWSFGCVLAEMATFIESGSQGMLEFSEARKITLQGWLTIRPFHAAVGPSSMVMAWLNDLEARQSTTNPRRGLLALIRDMLTFQPDKRPSSLEVSARLFLIAQRAAVDLVSGPFELLQQRADYVFGVECQRFRIWCEAVGIPDVSENGQKATWFLTENARIHFGAVNSAIQGVVKELQLQSSLLKLEPLEPCNNPTHYRLRNHVDELWNTLPMSVVRSMTSALEDSLLRKENLQALANDVGVNNGPSTYRRVQLLLSMREAMTSVDAYRHQKLQFLTERPIKLTEKISGMQLAALEMEDGSEKTVLMEVWEYQDTWLDRFDELLRRVDGLVSLLGKSETISSFPVLPCINFCHLVEQQALGLLYQMPASKVDASLVQRPTTLADLIKHTKSRPQRPLLEDVFAIAYILASSMLTFHKAGWLHRGISSFNLVFFLDGATPAAGSMRSPYLVGFNHSRQSNEYAFTEGPRDSVEVRDYQHPDYRSGDSKVRFREEFDYYSIGIVLLELGMWKPLRSITRDKKTSSAYQVRDFLLTEQVPLLGSYMGKRYRDAVEACISGNIFTQPNATADSARELFERKVVEPLLQGVSLYDNASLRLSLFHAS